MITAKYTPSRTAEHLASCLTKVINAYTRGGYTIGVIIMDQVFDKVTELIPQVECNNTAAKEHVTDIERQHRTIKKRARTMRSSLPFTYLLKDLVINLVYFVFFLEFIPASQGDFSQPVATRDRESPACELESLFRVVRGRSH
ncbi:hypothetical protein ACHAWF_005548 [Thalassiosira exigua]